jgi:hypothetical protein
VQSNTQEFFQGKKAIVTGGAGFVGCAVSSKADGQVYNSASSVKVSINELATQMLVLLDTRRQLRVQYGDPLAGVAENRVVQGQPR